VKQWWCVLAMTTAAASGASLPGTAVPVVPVTLYVDFQQDAPPAVVDAIKREVNALMAPAGLRFDWRPLADFKPERVSVAVAVAHFESRCDLAGLQMRGNAKGSLGWTEISDGTILPFMHVDCERTRTFLQSRLLGHRAEDRESIFGRALGRVLAHELYHVFAETARHAEQGAAKEEYTVADLVAPAFSFHEKQTRALRASPMLAAIRAAAR
jgi:hypothetical protein